MIDGEEKLIKDAIRGNSSAFGALYDSYQPMIYRFVLVKTGSREEAEDITHQVFLSAWQNVRTYKHRGHPFSSWLYQIARNQVIDFYRAKKSDIALDALDPEYFAVPTTVSADLAAKLEIEKVRRAIEQLKPDYQDVIILRFIEDVSLKETAAAIGKTEGAVKLMQHRAMKELQKILGVHEANEPFRNPQTI
ncbi:MAG TPA: sigma-70 family RNA polymerase sigma factor [Candidatus Paceibacterota bacterium]|nr:sigma-70 family RNA polymerase sigma factor [Candidatus Paceibacterota bacterium]